MKQKKDYSLIKFLEIRFADPISSMKLANNYLVIGTMMGRVNLYDISEKNGKNIVVLCELNSENISDIAYNEKEKSFYVGIGDEEIKVFSIEQLSTDTIPQSNSINIYDSETQHTTYCENAFILFSSESFFRIQLPQIEEGTLNIMKIDSQYEVKSFNENEIYNDSNIKKTLPTTNYIVPFDFDGKRFLWVEFLSSTERNICVANVPLLNSDKIVKKDLNKSIGHICQAKLLPNNRVFIVHTLNKCEIRTMDEEFILLEKFEHIGEEVLAIDICFNEENGKDSNSNGMDEVIFHKNRIDDEIRNEMLGEKVIVKRNKNDEINTNRILETSDNINRNKKEQKEENGNKDYLYIKQNILKEKEVDIKDICITTLDIDGNVNLFRNKEEKTLFNLYRINEIPQDHKDKHFFSMGYAYYIKSDLNYYCISSDHGCYIIKEINNH